MQEVIDRLKSLEDELRDVGPFAWNKVELWGNKALPTIMKHCPEHTEQFKSLLKTPTYPATARAVSPRPVKDSVRYIFTPERYPADLERWADSKKRNEQQDKSEAAAYKQKCKNAYERILSFLGGIVYEMSTSQSNRSVRIGGNTTSSTIIVGDGNSVNAQTSQSHRTSKDSPKRKLLILAANPKDSTRLRLDEEVRDISEGLKRSRHRDDFEIIQRWAVRPRDFQRAMLEEAPQLVHFSGHGEGEAGLYFENEAGNTQRVSGEALASLFRLFARRSPIECVVLNGCYSQAQAKEIAAYVPYVIGMQQAIDDRAAIEFAVGFYDALGNGESVDFAFESGQVAMALHSTGCTEMPVLLTKPVSE